MNPAAGRPWTVGGLLFVSGACALVYQIAWTREFRLVFGHSTAASAAVLAIFIGGLGLGAITVGRRADRHPRPLGLYGRLEALVALSAALTPALLDLVRWAYVALGGTAALGSAGGSVARLLLAALVLAVPTLLMGATLPAAARDATGESDASRRSLALVYGLNTLGAVAGCSLATFVSLESLGTRRTLWLACVANLAVAAAAGRLARPLPPEAAGRVATREAEGAVPAPFVLGAAAAVGFAFFLMELVWYRLLAPLLGGSVFTFGLVLAVALAGIGTGGAAYALLGGRRRATMPAFAATALLEAVALAVPFALGDRIALLALFLRPLGHAGFLGHVLAWSAVTALVVFPAAAVAGYQFPLLVSLLGSGRLTVGRHVGLVYGANTAGSVAGALAGGFGLMPFLTAPGCWRAAAVGLLVLGLAAAARDALRTGAWRRLGVPALLALTATLLVRADGPTAAWRHSGIGAGRAEAAPTWRPNDVVDWLREQRRVTRFEAEGVESSVAIQAPSGLAFVINGKVDGSARSDAPTQVMSGLLGALLHEDARRALVVGLGTGSTAGWLADAPGMERVDVVELEGAVLEVARRCAPVNRGVLDNPRVHIRVEDARETLLVTPERYDLVVSEPSNPYRAGVASLFTREYYGSVARRLKEGGLFLQWVQAYEVDPPSIRSIYATLDQVFPHVETWQVHTQDLLLVASARPLVLDAPRLRARVAEEPYRSALAHAWRVDSLEGVVARFVAGSRVTRRLAEAARPDEVNSDDRNRLEFGFARTLGTTGLFTLESLRDEAARLEAEGPALAGGSVDLLRVWDERVALYSGVGESPPEPRFLSTAQTRRAQAHAHYVARNRPAARAAWRAQERPPSGPTELALVAEVEAEAGDEGAEPVIGRLRAFQPAEADACLARLRLRQGRFDEALAALETALVRYRDDPWPAPHVMQGALDVALELASREPALAPRVERLLLPAFALQALDEVRTEVLFLIASSRPPAPSCVELLAPQEPHVPWSRHWLAFREACYTLVSHPLRETASRDVRAFAAREPGPLLEAPPSASPSRPAPR